ncbi:hypothetical protein V8C40DRAFT_233876 [Trichoderma camerunense]
MHWRTLQRPISHGFSLSFLFPAQLLSSVYLLGLSIILHSFIQIFPFSEVSPPR